MSSIDPAVLAALKARHIAFLEARIVSSKAEASFRANVSAVYKELLATRLRDLVRASALADAANALLTGEAVERAIRPIAKKALTELFAEIRAEKGKVSDRVSLSARKRIDALVSKPGLIPGRFLREIVKEDAVDEVMRDVLYDAIKEFTEQVNPFFADWGLPALIKKISPFGIGKGLGALRAEFDRRLEPEMRKFIQGFSKKSIKRMAEFTIEHGDEPKFVEVRRRLAAWLLAQEIADLARATDAEAVLLGQEIALDMAALELDRSEHRARRRALLEQAIAARQDRTVAEVLAELGVTFTPDLDAVAAATWPFVRAALSSAPVKAWFAQMIGEFYDAEMAG